MPPIILTKKFIKQCLITIAETNPTISFTEFATDCICHKAVIREFGSWNNLRLECGLPLNKFGPAPKVRK